MKVMGTPVVISALGCKRTGRLEDKRTRRDHPG